MSDLILYNYDLDENCYRVRLLLSLLGIEAKTIAVDVVPGRENLSATFRARSPLGALPILEDGDLVLFNLEAILIHLAARHGSKRRLLADDPVQSAKIMQWLGFNARELRAAEQARLTAMLDAPGHLPTLSQAARSALRAMDDHLIRRQHEGAEFFVGDEPSLADVALFPAFALSRDYNVDHDAFPALRRWARTIRRLDGFITMPGIPDYH